MELPLLPAERAQMFSDLHGQAPERQLALWNRAFALVGLPSFKVPGIKYTL